MWVGNWSYNLFITHGIVVFFLYYSLYMLLYNMWNLLSSLGSRTIKKSCYLWKQRMVIWLFTNLVGKKWKGWRHYVNCTSKEFCLIHKTFLFPFRVPFSLILLDNKGWNIKKKKNQIICNYIDFQVLLFVSLSLQIWKKNPLVIKE